MIYLDNAATTQMFEKGVDVYKKYACQSFYNPSAGYNHANDIAKDLNSVRDAIKRKLGVNGSMIFTGGATESNNLAIMGSKRNGKWEYVFSEGEHPSVYNVAKELANAGHIVHFVKLQKNGQIDYFELEKVLNDRTRLISIMHVSNETGAINDLKIISAIRKQLAPKALLHVDGVQAFCKIDGFTIEGLGVDFYTISAHKFHGPKGVGALYVRDINTLKPIVYGGGQESGYRSGTENVAGIMAMGYAVNNIDVYNNFQHVAKLNSIMCQILSQDARVHIQNYVLSSPYILNAWFEGVNAETLVRALGDEGVLIGKGSACSTKKSGNRILESVGFGLDVIKSHVRISFSELNTEEEIKQAGKIILSVYNDIREKVS